MDVVAGAALRVSRASTTIELGDGQSFAIAGLLQNDFDNAITKVPGLGDIPVLGVLFRSAKYAKKQTELVILVTTRLVKPISPSQAALPTEKYIPPTDTELFLMGQSEGSAVPVKKGMALPQAANGGLAGAHGHIIK